MDRSSFTSLSLSLCVCEINDIHHRCRVLGGVGGGVGTVDGRWGRQRWWRGQPYKIHMMFSSGVPELLRWADSGANAQLPCMNMHPTDDRYPAINKPAGLVHWLKHSKEAENVGWAVILDAGMIVEVQSCHGSLVLTVEKGKPVAAFYV